MAFIAWRVVQRVRRSIGRQPVRTKRLTARIVLYSVLCLLIALLGLFRPITLAGLGGGLVLGVLVALLGLRLTRYETLPEGRFYTPNLYVGATISLLFIFRLFYRISAVAGATASQAPRDPRMMLSPLTFFVFGLLAGYYVAYYAGILLRCRTA
ncbi:MAG TPA: DUF1453 domain-containing protein [Verrucomicrobiae bacterium]|jgi:hypothetical protein|nr:DUF1453 domain-containing protein [Verrucomicrobiae bacterium]